jgi:hypothetical protein
MRFKPWILAGFLVAAVGVQGFLMARESIPKAQDATEVGPSVVEPLLNVVFRPEDREKNLGLFGLKTDEVQKAVRLLKGLDDPTMRQKIRTLLNLANNESQIAQRVCKGQEGLPRYNLLVYLVNEESGAREPLSLTSITTLVVQPWSANSPIMEVCKTAEIGKGRRADAMAMAVAAILERREEDLLKKRTPWGSGVGTVWSWDRVVERFPGIAERVTRYMVSMHLVLEVAHEDGGFCGN